MKWDGRPADPLVGSWYWLYRLIGDDVRHAAWYWCEECRQWEAEPGLSFSPEAVAEQGWRLLGATKATRCPSRDFATQFTGEESWPTPTVRNA
jgi:hypothetical protein